MRTIVQCVCNTTVYLWHLMFTALQRIHIVPFHSTEKLRKYNHRSVINRLQILSRLFVFLCLHLKRQRMVSLKWPIQFGFQLNLTLIQYLNSSNIRMIPYHLYTRYMNKFCTDKTQRHGKKTIYLKRIPKKQINVYSLKHKYLRTFFLIFMS